MTSKISATDAQLEREINSAHADLLARATDPVARREALTQMTALMAKRRPEVARHLEQVRLVKVHRSIQSGA